MNWTCPYCNRDTTIVSSNFSESVSFLKIPNKDGLRSLTVFWTICPNSECKRLSLFTTLSKARNKPNYADNWESTEFIKSWRLLPESYAKVFPNYIPTQIIQDYTEACGIVDLSPKASATLSRRCLQGIIRDFWGISKPRLVDEINAIKDKIDPLTWQAIDAVRSIGNIGAHMEKDINLIIDVEQNEAGILINLIELLLKEWYIHRHERQLQLEKIIEINLLKQEERKGTS